MDNWAAVVRLAQRQFGVFSREQFQQLSALPADRVTGVLRSALKSRRIERLAHGLYRLPGSQPDWYQRASAALLAAGAGSALSHSSAAVLYGLQGVSRTDPTIDVSVPDRSKQVVPAGVRLHRPVASFQPWLRNGLPVTRVARTIIDLAGVLSPEQLALDSAQRRFRALPSWLTAEFEAVGSSGRRGLGNLEALLRARGGHRTDSPLEVPVWSRLRRRGFRPLPQHIVLDVHGRAIMRVDFAWPAERFALHVDSFEWHTSRGAFDKDAAQRNQLRAAGWSDMVITDPMLANDLWLDELALHLARLSPQARLRFPEVG